MLKKLVLALATLTTGLVAGLYYAFTVAINPAFASLSDAHYLLAMQEINDAILNPAFAAIFFGAPLLLLLATGLNARRPWRARFWLLVAATSVFWVGSLGVTLQFNIRLNEQLAVVAVQQLTPAQATKFRQQFAAAWNRWHNVRTLASVLAFGLGVSACLAAPPARSSPT